MENLTIALIQSDLIWHNPEQNRINFTKKIHRINNYVDVIILPEMFTTGFSMNPQHISETMQGKTLKWMQRTASEKNAAIAGSIIIFENDNYYNRFLFVHPSGEIDYYDKRHLFTLAGEDKIYTAGVEKVINEYKGWKICPQVCYDLRFPVWARNVENYDVLLYVANWPKVRIKAWNALLQARAIENMCYTVGVNRVGIDENEFEYDGHSAVYNCLGEIITSVNESEEVTVISTLNKNHIHEIRNKLNFLNDKDSFKFL
ncbi:amidohydrolase [Lutibacter sp. B1]|uniref:amidohydrolase n=1 Tax=Lutibacter sp. B1 TaxID=2725996 RepID=UPI0014577F5E|nr:amidohydrolase [Lutibacter sp. B1]NLP57178.1 amidohydrolase [Lutibacter sp. B1]